MKDNTQRMSKMERMINCSKTQLWEKISSNVLFYDIVETHSKEDNNIGIKKSQKDDILGVEILTKKPSCKEHT